MQKHKVGIIGATGYAGAELVRLLLQHPYITLNKLSSVSYEGQKFSDIYPQLKEICDETLCSEAEVLSECDVIFAALPNCLSEPLAKACVEQDKLFIDLGADFRLDSEEEYKTWYGKPFDNPSLHKLSTYALPELFSEQIKKAKIIGNPGCYPTSIALGLAPALLAGYLDTQNIVIDAKSGATGSGRGLTLTTHFTECNEAFSPYKIGSHRHTPEIEQTLSYIYGNPIQVTFVPHLLPINRGIISTIYAGLSPEHKNASAEEIIVLYKKKYDSCKFVRILENGKVANLKNVRYSNYCDISVHKDEHTDKLILVSAIDNMVKGAAGQAIQNMNLVLGFPEESALTQSPPMF